MKSVHARSLCFACERYALGEKQCINRERNLMKKKKVVLEKKIFYDLWVRKACQIEKKKTSNNLICFIGSIC